MAGYCGEPHCYEQGEHTHEPATPVVTDSECNHGCPRCCGG